MNEMEIEGRNPSKFKIGDYLQCVYTNNQYQLVELKRGMAKLLDLETFRIKDSNADNNPHYKKINNQLKLQL